MASVLLLITGADPGPGEGPGRLPTRRLQDGTPDHTHPGERLRRILLIPPLHIVCGLVLTAAIVVSASLLLRLAGVRPGTLPPIVVVAAATVAGLLLLARLLEGRRPAEVGYRPDGAVRQLVAGAALGALVVSGGIALLAAAGWYRVREAAGPGTFLLRAAVLYAAVAVAEEAVARGLVFRVVEERAGSAVALAFSGALFGAGHLGNPHSGAAAAVGIAVAAGLLLGAAWMLTRTLWMAIGIHWTWNLFEGPVFGVPVSGMEPRRALLDGVLRGPPAATGGAFGPEAGLVLVAAAGAAAVWLLVLAARRGHFVPLRRARGFSG